MNPRQWLRRTGLIFSCLAALSSSIKDIVHAETPSEQVDEAEGYYQKAQQLRKEGKLEEAENFYRQALKLKPKSVEYNNGLAVALLLQKRYAEGLEYDLKAFEYDKGDDGKINFPINVYNVAQSAFFVARKLEKEGKKEESFTFFKMAHQFLTQYIPIGNEEEPLRRSKIWVDYISKTYPQVIGK